MNDTSKSTDDASRIPSPDDGFHEPAADTKRRNWITLVIIVTLLILWILFGLRRVLFGI